MSVVASVWKKRVTEAVKLERKEPIVLQRASRPTNRAHAAKKSAISSKANMKRVK